MSAIIPFDSKSNAVAVPEFARAAGGRGSIAAALAVTFPVLRYKGKVWSLSIGDERKPVMREDEPDQPAPYVDVVILDVGPSADRKLNAKVWYAKAFVEGDEPTSPDCSSDDGISPRADSKDKQSDKCATCDKNVWGSGKNGVGRECGDSKRLAVATADKLNEPMLLNVPAGSLGGLSEYFNWLLKKGIEVSYAVVTRIGFDYTAAHPKLTFKPIGFLSEDPRPYLENEQIDYIVGRKALPKPEQEEDGFSTKDAPAFAKKDAPKEPPKAKKTVEPEVGEEPAEKPAAKAAPKTPPKDAPKTKKDDSFLDAPATVKVEVEEAPSAPATKAAKAEPVEVEEVDDADLDNLDFDD